MFIYSLFMCVSLCITYQQPPGGNPTVEVDLCTEQALFRAAVPSGASTGDTYDDIWMLISGSIDL